MPIQLRKKEGESVNAFLYRFNKKVQHSGLMKEVRSRKFFSRATNRRRQRVATLYRLKKREEITRLKKHGYK